jgi:bacteriocin biosynthesis cyclodehydratase domain-containing protein
VLRIGPTYVPGEGACFACHERELADAYPLYPELAEHRRAHPTTAITLGPASGIVGTLLAMELLHLLIGAPVATRDRALLIDMRTLTTQWQATHQQEDCDVCG